MTKRKEMEIYRDIKLAITQHKLLPNMQLVEEALADAFQVSRTPIRNVLRRLAMEKLVTVIPYRGAFVSCPSVEEAREVFEMRRVIEAAMVRKLCEIVQPEQMAPLKMLLKEEHQASQAGDVMGALDVTVDFHLKLAELADNYYYYHFLEELISLTSVIIALYGTDQSFCHDHEELIEVVISKDGERAAQVMTEHLKQIEYSLDFTENTSNVLNLKDIFQHH
ncbi:GntR family transcriptional regulator [Paenibacillus sp. HN-1]|uniref:GntR family transcriptional regulator n=1 Tax=Paenibacillus TaxID=44249 RepID=UPI001CA9D1FB|nr:MULTISPECIES: GntR family transcriptional regulator [Paenibacillus]MBY9079475.1 GntR family transcriptional regulator [Paenibacillus sp. CGMCC 1.18879]MBY9085564.1 GntR family transcriptional regulator [Paenibacillus sinensis]